MGYRYVRFQGFGDQVSASTTRLVELQAIERSTNRLLGKTPISGESVNAGATIDKVTDGNLSMASGTFPLWWSGAGIPTLTYDLGAIYEIDLLRVFMFSTVNDPRQTKFKLSVSKDNINWELVVDYSLNTDVQPDFGWSFAVGTTENILKSLKTDWTANDYYNFSDLNRVEEVTRMVNDKIKTFYGSGETMSYVTDRTNKTIEFADSLNRIESNILKLYNRTGKPRDFITPKTNWTYNNSFSYADANRLENNLKVLYYYVDLNLSAIPYAGQYTAGQQGVI